MFENKKIIVVLPKRLGDAIFYTPALAFLKKHVPSCQIDAIALTGVSKQVFQNNPVFSETYCNVDSLDYAALSREYDVCLEMHKHGKGVREALEELSVEKLSGGTHEALIPAADHSLNYISKLIDKPVEAEDRRYHLFPSEKDFEAVRGLGVDQNDLLVVMHLGCHGASKSGWKFWRKQAHEKAWPLNYFVKTAKMLTDKYPNIKFVLTGSKAEAVLASQFKKKVKNTIDLTCKTSVLECAALMKSINCVVTGDTGISHVACAMGVPVIGLYGPTEVKRTGLYPESNFRVQLVKESLSDIAPEEVVGQIKQLFAHVCD